MGIGCRFTVLPSFTGTWTGASLCLQMVEFNLILKAAGKETSAAMFWKLLIGTVLMLAFGYLGETKVINPWLGFAVGMAGWGFILSEILVGEAGGTATQSARQLRLRSKLCA